MCVVFKDAHTFMTEKVHVIERNVIRISMCVKLFSKCPFINNCYYWVDVHKNKCKINEK